MGRFRTKYNSEREKNEYELEKTARIKMGIEKKINNKVLEADRDYFIENLLNLNQLLEERISGGISDMKIARCKNITQSLIYLTLNDRFYREILKIRGKLGISSSAFNSKNDYNEWAESYGNIHYRKVERHYRAGRSYNAVYEEIKSLVNKYRLCHRNNVLKLSHILYFFTAYNASFDKLYQVFAPYIYDEKYTVIGSGFDVGIKEYKNSEDAFYTVSWTYHIFPFDNLTGLDIRLKEFFVREFITAKTYKKYDTGYIDYLLKKFNAKTNKDKIKATESLRVIKSKDSVLLGFMTNFYTKPSDIMNLIKVNHDKIRQAKRKLEIKSSRGKILSDKFYRNYRMYILRKKCLTYTEIDSQIEEECVPYEREDGKYKSVEFVFSGKANTIKGELGKFKANIKSALKRKIVF